MIVCVTAPETEDGDSVSVTGWPPVLVPPEGKENVTVVVWGPTVENIVESKLVAVTVVVAARGVIVTVVWVVSIAVSIPLAVNVCVEVGTL